MKNYGLEIFDKKKNVISNHYTLLKIKNEKSLIKLYQKRYLLEIIHYFSLNRRKTADLFLEIEIVFENDDKQSFYYVNNYNLQKIQYFLKIYSL